MLLAGAAQATTFQFVFYGETFDFDYEEIGTGSFSTDTALTEGFYALSSLANPVFSFTVLGTTFNNSHLITPLADIDVEVVDCFCGQSIYFGGLSSGFYGGSLDFVNGTTVLSFAPDFWDEFFISSSFVGEDVPQDMRYGYYEGFSPAAVPEPASWAMLIAGFGLVGAMARRRRVLA